MKRYLFASLASIFLLASCNNEPELDQFYSVSTEGGEGTVTATYVSVSQLEFQWEAVEGVNQYGYSLINEDGRAQRQGVTSTTSCRFDRLEPNSTYTFELEAFGANGSPTVKYSVTAATKAIVQLAAPDPSTFAINVEEGRVTISWVAVANAEEYSYILLNDAGKELLSDVTEESSVTFNTLPIGDYQLLVTAESSDEGFLPSDTTVFDFTRERQPVSTITGNYTSAILGTKYSCSLVQYEDGLYEILAFYGVEGYNLQFNIGAGNVVEIVNGKTDANGYKTVSTGAAASPTISINPAACKYSAQRGTKTLRLSVYAEGSASPVSDTFEWK